MADNTVDTKQVPAHISLASRMLGAKLRVKLAAAPLSEPWRSKNAKRKSKGKRHK